MKKRKTNPMIEREDVKSKGSVLTHRESTDSKVNQQTGHTPGPWKLSEENNDSGFGPALVVRASDGNRIADCGRSSMSDGFVDHRHKLAKANASLIALAPDLLVACKLALKIIQDSELNDNILTDHIKSTISKVEVRGL